MLNGNLVTVLCRVCRPEGGVGALLGALLLATLPIRDATLLLLMLPFMVPPDFKVFFIVDFMLVSWLILCILHMPCRVSGQGEAQAACTPHDSITCLYYGTTHIPVITWYIIIMATIQHVYFTILLRLSSLLAPCWLQGL